MRSPRPSILLSLILCPAALSITSCKTIYSDMYSYQKNYFDPYESRDYDKRQLEDAKKQAEVARLAAETEAKKQADKLDGGAAGLQLDSGLGGLGGMGGGSIPGLGSPAPASGSPMSSIPGLDASPSMGAPGMGTPADATMGAPAATPSKNPTPLPGL
jgi:hypothetical protein